MDQGHLQDLVECSLLDDGNWLALGAEETVAPLSGYVVSFVCFHERGLTLPLHSFVVSRDSFIICRCDSITESKWDSTYYHFCCLVRKLSRC